jgi:hypothetical protein
LRWFWKDSFSKWTTGGADNSKMEQAFCNFFSRTDSLFNCRACKATDEYNSIRTLMLSSDKDCWCFLYRSVVT